MNKTELMSWVLRGSQRRIIFAIIEDNKIPTQIFQEASQINDKISRQNVSDILTELKEKELIKCINNDSRIGRIYQLTHLGNKIKDLI